MYTDDEPKFEDGEDDETPEQKEFANNDGLEGIAKDLGWTLEETRQRLGLK
jgi:hypothetical protein